MKKVLPITISIIIAAVIIIAIALSVKLNKTVDWEESFNETSNKPYGVSVLYRELHNLFKNHKIRTVYHQPASYLQANSKNGHGDHVAKGNYIIIGNSLHLLDDSIDELLNFVSNGNTLFISDYYFPQKLQDSLGIETEFIPNKTDSISLERLKYISIGEITIDRNPGDYYFTNFDPINHRVLGHSKINYWHVNFLQIPFGEGSIYLHTEPKAFTNYNLLKDNRYLYAEGILSYLPNNNVYFDSYTKIQTSYNSQVEKESNLSWFLEQIAFKWAWYTALIFGLLFMIFNAKRRQRIIKIVKPLQNTTVDFVKTVSNLYFETQDHKNLIDKKITYFLEKIRTDYNLDTPQLNDVFIEKLSSKSGKKKAVVKKTIDYINWLRNKNEFFEDNLINLNHHIEAFYTA